MECKRVRHYIESYYSGRLSARLSEQVRDHISSCDDCSRQIEFFQRLDQLLDNQSPIPAPEDFTMKVMQKIHSVPVPQKSSPFMSRQWGMSLVAVGLLLFFLNLTPLGHSLVPLPQKVRTTTVSMMQQLRSWSVQEVGEELSDGLYDFTDLVTRPINMLINLYKKEGYNDVL